jgi:hypothetical protein
MLAAHADRSRERAAAVGAEFGQSSFVFSDDAVSHWSLAWPSHAWQRFSARASIARVRLHDYADIRVVPTFFRRSCSSRANALKLSA